MLFVLLVNNFSKIPQSQTISGTYSSIEIFFFFRSSTLISYFLEQGTQNLNLFVFESNKLARLMNLKMTAAT